MTNTIRPYVPVRLAPEHARIVNAVRQRVWPWQVMLHGQACSVSAQHNVQPVPFSAACAVNVRIGEGVWRLEFGSGEFLSLLPELRPLLQKSSAELLWGQLPEAVRIAVTASLLGPLVDKAKHMLGCTVAVESVQLGAEAAENAQSQDSDPSCICLTLTMPAPAGLPDGATEDQTHIFVPVRLFWPDAAAAWFVAERLDTLPVMRRSQAAVPVMAGVNAGWVTLQMYELNDLAVGDVLLPERWDNDAPLLRLPDGMMFCCGKDGAMFNVLGPWTGADSLEGTMSEVTGAAANGQTAEGEAPVQGVSAAVNVDALPVTVHFELEKMQLTVGDLARLSEGYTFVLGSEPAAPVTLRVGAHAVGTGRIVDINGTLGVQVVALEAAGTDAD